MRFLAIPIWSAALLLAQSSASDGVYTSAQAQRGAGLYVQSCASCHGDKLEGRGQAPPLTGPEFQMNWSGATLAELFEKMQNSMPGDKPGSLEPAANAAILAYLLSRNGFPDGKAELPADPARLRGVRFEQNRK